MCERQAVCICADLLRSLTPSDGHMFECDVLSSAITLTRHCYGHAKHLPAFKIMQCSETRLTLKCCHSKRYFQSVLIKGTILPAGILQLVDSTHKIQQKICTPSE